MLKVTHSLTMKVTKIQWQTPFLVIEPSFSSWLDLERFPLLPQPCNSHEDLIILHPNCCNAFFYPCSTYIHLDTSPKSISLVYCFVQGTTFSLSFWHSKAIPIYHLTPYQQRWFTVWWAFNHSLFNFATRLPRWGFILLLSDLIYKKKQSHSPITLRHIILIFPKHLL